MAEIDFYYWAEQCPHNNVLRELLNSLKRNKEYQVEFHNVAENHQLADKMNMYSPTLLVIDNKLRWNGPISKQELKALNKGKLPKREPYRVDLSNNLITGTIKPLTEETVVDTYKSCNISLKNKNCCISKASWVKKVRTKFNLPNLGLLHYVQGGCVGGAEFVPSSIVPYSIPKDSELAFLTCSFLSSEQADYRSFPLKKLEEQLPALGYREIVAIASEEVVFPNGTLDWFLERGYIDLGEVYYESSESAMMHLVKKKL